MKKPVAVLLALSCLGCAASASQTYRATTTPPSEWHIEGAQSAFGRLQIRINGESVIDGSISIWSGEGRLSGNYRNQSLVADCEKGEGAARTSCRLMLDGTRITTLHFRAL